MHDGGQADRGAEADEAGEPGVPDGLERVGERRVDRQLGVVLHAGDDERHRDVQHGADEQRAEDAARHVALRVLVSSAAVATTSKPMKAKKTTEAAVKMPMHAEVGRREPNISWISGGACSPPAASAARRRRDERAVVVGR